MKRYKKKSFIEAEQFDGSLDEAKRLELILPGTTRDFPYRYSMNTKQGQVEVNSLDYIISNPDGERYPCNWETFEDTYELIDE